MGSRKVLYFCFCTLRVFLVLLALVDVSSLNIPLPLGLVRPNRIVDLRSDTVTRPTAAMRKAMSEAEVGDDVFEDDPTARSLETRVAKMFDKEASLFLPSGTMANLAAVMTWCSTRGSEMIVGDGSHMFLYEQGSAAQIAGVQSRTVSNKRDGTMKIDSLEKSLRSDNIHTPITELVCLENTHANSGGRILPDGYSEAVAFLTQKRGIPLHIDGARIWNAATALELSVSQLTRHADSVTACLSKGLGAPVGSMLIGSSKFVAKARRARKALGGGMRQIGVLAAAANVALDDFASGVLLSSHAQAKTIANALNEMSGFSIDMDSVQTNILLIHIDEDSPVSPNDLTLQLKEKGVLVLPFGPKTVRLVTHRDITNDDVSYAIEAFRTVSKRMWPRPKAAVADKLSIETIQGTTSTVNSASTVSSAPSTVVANAPPPTGKEVREFVEASTTNAIRRDPVPVTVAVPLQTLKSTIIAATNLPVEYDAPNQVPGMDFIEIISDKVSVRDAWEQEALLQNADVKVYAEFDKEIEADDVVPTMPQESGNIQHVEADEIDREYFEEVVVHGMSVSNDGFVVLLKGVVCDRVLKVLVTPSDPMADGLDTDQVETPEAVTLLQLLQGIDVESYLSKDAITTKFTEALKQEALMNIMAQNTTTMNGIVTNPNSISSNNIVLDADSPQQFQPSINDSLTVQPQHLFLRRVKVTNVALPKVFNARLCGSVRSSPQGDKPLAIFVENETSDNSDAIGPVEVSNEFTVTPNAPFESVASIMSAERSCVVVDVQSAFEAIALALRHSAVIEVKSSLLQDPDLSFTLEDLKTHFPKMLEADANFDTTNHQDVYDSKKEMERLQRLLFAALRLGNPEKIHAVKRQLELYSYSAGTSIQLPAPPPKAEFSSSPRFDM